jgi:hypothetical protein
MGAAPAHGQPVRVLAERPARTRAGRLSTYDLECGAWIDAAFATFQGIDPNEDLALVFAHVVRRLTHGGEDPNGNPLRVEGAGWAGFVGFGGLSRLAVFSDPHDGCRAAAVVLQSAEHRDVQAAYRAGDAAGLAVAIESSRLGGGELVGLAQDVRPALVRRRRLGGTLRARVGRLYSTVITQNTP